MTTNNIVDFKNFDLSTIGQVFKIADFERKVSSTTVSKIITAMIEGRMYNKIIRVITNSDGSYSVLDGQHRLKALEVMHRAYGLKTFDLTLELWNEDEARDAYVNINSGRSLKSTDFTKALDDGTVLFFNEFKDILNHYRSKKAFSFYECLQAIQYSRKGSQILIHVNELKDFMDSITSLEKNAIKRGVEAVYTTGEPLNRCLMAKASIFRNLVRIEVEKQYDTIELYELGVKMASNDLIKNILLNQTSPREATRLIYDITNREIIQKAVKVVNP